ncbi:alanine:cation symporter family protein [Glutamicibacter sp. HZAU]|uniref:alanine:cation symporter family protein n=1 Tax=Glutamicibacter sp. HZAU TaxID=2049891 RepID=UPI000FFB61EE|nr:alanine:cation symporter family protein [Glutamicibacter sp. HZAU]RWZ85308.1 hypothetical protein EKH49_02040 [Glutamicibacter sp. HZAU]
MTGRIIRGKAVLYFGCVLVILFSNFSEIPRAFSLIFEGAFTGDGVQDGVIGVAIIGIQRALFSNVAGAGTAGMAHSSTKNKRPARKGIVAAGGSFIDSVVVCTMTALAIIVTGQYTDQGQDGIALTTAAFATVNELFPYLLTVSVLLFAFSAILSYSYYGQLPAGFLFGQSAVVRHGYNLVWLATIVIGSAVSLSAVVRFSDAVFFLMTVPNVLGLFFMANVIRKELNGHCDDLKTGVLQMVPLAERSTLLGNPISGESDKSLVSDKA